MFSCFLIFFVLWPWCKQKYDRNINNDSVYFPGRIIPSYFCWNHFIDSSLLHLCGQPTLPFALLLLDTLYPTRSKPTRNYQIWMGIDKENTPQFWLNSVNTCTGCPCDYSANICNVCPPVIVSSQQAKIQFLWITTYNAPCTHCWITEVKSQMTWLAPYFHFWTHFYAIIFPQGYSLHFTLNYSGLGLGSLLRFLKSGFSGDGIWICGVGLSGFFGGW